MELALPNLHPAVLHFPLVLAPLALLFDLGTFRTQDKPWGQLATALWIAAALAASVTFLAGRYAADGLVNVPPQVQPAIGDHADWAQYSLIGLWIAAVLRTGAFAMRENASVAMGMRAAVMLVGVAIQGMLFLTADKGGALVYQHALAVQLPECPTCEVAPPPPVPRAKGTLTLADADGTLTWTPGAGEGELLGATETDATEGIALVIDGEQTLLLPTEINDVQLNAWLDLSKFEGEAWLLHHFDGEAGGALVVSPKGGARLVDIGETLKDLDTSTDALPAKAAFSVSAAGAHLKGLSNGKMIVHGHTTARPAGKVGLRFVGTGTVGITKFEAVRLEGGQH